MCLLGNAKRTKFEMSKKLKHISIILLVSVLLMPTIIKFEHHHEHLKYDKQTPSNTHSLEENCVVCNFEFSLFLAESFIAVSKKIEQFDGYVEYYRSFNLSNFSKYFFSLRAPPILQI